MRMILLMNSEINSAKKQINLKFLKRIQCDFLELSHVNKENKQITFPYKHIIAEHLEHNILNKESDNFQEILDALYKMPKPLMINGMFLHTYLTILMPTRSLNFD